MKKVKITVLKRTFDSELAKKYGVHDLSACPILNEGQTFYTYSKKPETLCDEAWNAMSKYVFALAYGASSEPFFLGDWIKTPGVAICSCNDGLRPVIFKIESTESQANCFSTVTETPEQSEKAEETNTVSDDTEIKDNYVNNAKITSNPERIIVEIPRKEVFTQETPDEEEFIVSVYKDTKSIDLLDKFEGISGDRKKSYRRMVINPGNYVYGKGIYYHYVIERSYNSNYVGDITFTDFKKGNTYDLNHHIQLELTDEIIAKYKDTDKFYKLQKPYHLRAQNSSNRTGYGWEWDWSYGVGDYTEGTLYGETTDYIFSGVYISSEYRYTIDSRLKFNEKDRKIELKGYIRGIYPLIVYNGKLSEITSMKMESVFIPVMKSSKQKLLPVSFCLKEQKIYVSSITFNAYESELTSDKILETIKNQ